MKKASVSKDNEAANNGDKPDPLRVIYNNGKHYNDLFKQFKRELFPDFAQRIHEAAQRNGGVNNDEMFIRFLSGIPLDINIREQQNKNFYGLVHDPIIKMIWCEWHDKARNVLDEKITAGDFVVVYSDKYSNLHLIPPYEWIGIKSSNESFKPPFYRLEEVRLLELEKLPKILNKDERDEYKKICVVYEDEKQPKALLLKPEERHSDIPLTRLIREWMCKKGYKVGITEFPEDKHRGCWCEIVKGDFVSEYLIEVKLSIVKPKQVNMATLRLSDEVTYDHKDFRRRFKEQFER